MFPSNNIIDWGAPATTNNIQQPAVQFGGTSIFGGNSMTFGSSPLASIGSSETSEHNINASSVKEYAYEEDRN